LTLRRHVAGVVAAAMVALAAGTSGLEVRSSPAAYRAAPTGAARPLAQLPGGGRVIFPGRRVVAYYGLPGTNRLGVLGDGPPEAVGRRLRKQASAYRRRGRPVLPAFELITVVANSHPTRDGRYRTRLRAAVVRRYLQAARRINGLLVLDIQPGRSDFLTEARQYERFLREPDVGLALDPEWSMHGRQVPGRMLGHTDAATVNRVSAYLDGIVRRHRLPQKLLVVHQFTRGMVRDRGRVVARRGLAITFHIDGFGGQRIKRQKYAALTRGLRHYRGFKLFYRQDRNLMPPAQVLRLQTVSPDLISYQ